MTTETPTPPPTPPRDWSRVLLIVSFAAFLAACCFAATRNSPSTGPTPKVDLTQSLALFVAVATAIERFWEFLFDTYEKLVLAGSALLGGTAGIGQWVQQELREARDALALLTGKPDASTSSEVDAALARVVNARARVADLFADQEYVAFKRAVTILGSLVIGEVLSIGANLRILQAAGFGVNHGMDVLLTGLVVGAGPGPIHSFIGILQGVKDATGDLADLSRSATLQRASEALQSAVNGVITPPPAPPAPPAPPVSPGVQDTQKALSTRSAVNTLLQRS